jgi:hypothetical protein
MEKFYTSKIAKFILTRTKHIFDIRDNLPAGFEHFTLSTGDITYTSYYDFIDYIAENHPFECKVKTCYAEIEYSQMSWKWEFVKGSTKTDSAKTLVQALNDFDQKAKMLRDFQKFDM